ncbi:MAG: hypothetical protein LBJ77_03485 [Holosporales bacterium]|nr:hypothetical protein [Holosporales bacterium]
MLTRTLENQAFLGAGGGGGSHKLLSCCWCLLGGYARAGQLIPCIQCYELEVTNWDAFKVGRELALRGDSGPMPWYCVNGPPFGGFFIPSGVPGPHDLKLYDGNNYSRGERAEELLSPLLGGAGLHYSGESVPSYNDWVYSLLAGWWSVVVTPDFPGIGIPKMHSEIQARYSASFWRTGILGTVVGLGLLGTYVSNRYANKSSSKLTVLHLE